MLAVASPPTAGKQTACDTGRGKQGLVALCPGLVCGPHDVGVVSAGLGLLLQDGGQDPPHLGAGHVREVGSAGRTPSLRACPALAVALQAPTLNRLAVAP